MTPSIETALIALAVSQLLVPLLNGLLARRQTKHEQAVDQVPLLVERVGGVASDVKDIKADLRRVGEIDAAQRLQEQRIRALDAWQSEVRPQYAQVSNHVHTLMGERGARQIQRATNLAAAGVGGRPGGPRDTPWTVQEGPHGGLHVALQAHLTPARTTGRLGLRERARPCAVRYSQRHEDAVRHQRVEVRRHLQRRAEELDERHGPYLPTTDALPPCSPTL